MVNLTLPSHEHKRILPSLYMTIENATLNALDFDEQYLPLTPSESTVNITVLPLPPSEVQYYTVHHAYCIS